MKLLKKIYHFTTFLFFYMGKLIAANVYIAYDILTPKRRMNPGFVEIDLDFKSDFGLLLFSNLLSMTPGTLSIDINKQKEKLLIHLLYMNKVEETKKEISQIMRKIKQFSE